MSVNSMKKAAAALAALLVLGGCAQNQQEETMSKDTYAETMNFFQSLDFENGLDVVVKTFGRYPLQYAATVGLDGNAQVRPIEFKFEEDGVL